MDSWSADIWGRARRILRLRLATTWNWALGLVALACLGLGLLLRSWLLTATGLILLAASLFNLHLPPCGQPWLLKRHAAHMAWLDAPWTRRKRLQALYLGLGLAVLVGVLCSGSLGLFTLAVGGAGLWLAHRSTRNRLKDMDRDEALDRLRDQDRKERGEGP